MPIWIQYILLGVLIISILFSFLTSISETALVSSKKIKFESKITKNTSKAKKKKYNNLIKMVDNYSRPLISLVILNNIVNIFSSSIATFLISTNFIDSGWAMALLWIAFTFVMIMLCEITPKIIGKKKSEETLIYLYRMLYVIFLILRPFSFIISKLFKNENSETLVSSVFELRSVLKEVNDNDYITTSEHTLLKSTLSLSSKKIKDFYIPVDKVHGISETITEKSLKTKISKNKFTRLPIIKNNKATSLLNVKGYLIDIISLKHSEAFKKNIFSIENYEINTSLLETFEKMKNKRQHIISVVDKKKNFLGILTFEDIIENILGKIYDEIEFEKDEIFKINSNLIHCLPGAKLSEVFNDFLKTDPPRLVNKKTTIYEWVNFLKTKNFKSKIELEVNQQFSYKNYIIWYVVDKNTNKKIFEIDIIK